MQKVRLVMLACFALFMFGAFYASSSAFAEVDENSPAILLLINKGTELEGELKSSSGSLVQLSGEKPLTATSVSLLLKNCLIIAEHEFDTNLCHLVPIHFTGVKQGTAACRSENNKAEKDPIETALALLDLHLAAEESLEGTAEMKLQPLLLAWVLGTADEEEVKLVCGLVKIQVKGVIACLLLPGLKDIQTTEEVEIKCVVNASHDSEFGHCELLCEPWGSTHKIGLEADFNGSTFTDVWESVALKGALNHDVLIDD